MKPTQALIQLRVEELLTIRLDGAQFWDIRQYVAEQEAAGKPPWTIPEGGKPVSERTLWRYIQRTNRLIEQSCKDDGQKQLRHHVAQRRALYAKAVSAGDYRAALAAARDEAELLNLYPAKRLEMGGKNGGPVTLHIVEEITGHKPGKPLEVQEEIVTNGNGSNGTAENSIAPGTASLPQE